MLLSHGDRERRPGAGARAGRAAGRGLAAFLVVVLALLGALGWTYVLRGLGWFAAGSSVHDALPLLQLAGTDSQPLVRVIVAWLSAGLVVGVCAPVARPVPRGLLVGVVGIVLLLLASQASYALARNLHFTSILFSRAPGFGPWLEGLLLAAGCVVPWRFGARRRVGSPRPA